MEIALGIRTAETAAIYFEKTDHEIFHKVLPQKARTVEEAVAEDGVPSKYFRLDL